VAAVRLIVARCEVVYTGRLTAVLPAALRLLMLKSDGSVMVHADTGGFASAQSASTSPNRPAQRRLVALAKASAPRPARA
jgi:RecB family endonuclease NucS